MGRDNCLLTFEGEPLWQRQVRTLQKLAAGLQTMSGDRLLVLAVDLRR